MRRIVIDDGSTDQTHDVATKVASALGQVDVLKNEGNLGFSASLNRVLGLCGDTDFLFVHPDDIELIEQDYVERLLAHFQDDRVALVTGQATQFDRLPLMQRIYARLLNLDYLQEGVSELTYSLLKGDLIRAAAVRSSGGFGYALNPKFGLEDQSLAYRLRRAGYRILKDSAAHYRLSFGRAESLLAFLSREYDAGKLLGYAVISGLIWARLPSTPENYVRWWQRSTEVLSGTSLLGSALAAFLAPPWLGVGAMLGILTARTWWYVRMGRDFPGEAKLRFIVVGILTDLFTAPGFHYGLIKGLRARWGLKKARIGSEG
jgi:cellulose synthase/poly-beta-1,6-N-acetylglucosamine synthase-like glycosyltransferase